jgi:hypothetical protein
MSATPERVAGRTGIPTIVEFCGLPGVGKSYLAARVLGTLLDRGVVARMADGDVGPDVARPRRISRKLRWVLGQEVAKPIASTRALACIGSGQRDLSSAVSRSVQWFVMQGLLDAARRTPGVHVFQEGIVQALWSIGLRGNVSKLLRLLDEGGVPSVGPDLIVAVDAPAEEIRKRLQTRRSRHSRTQSLQSEELEAELRRGADLVDELLAWWEGNGERGRVVRLANRFDELPDVGQVVRFIESLQRR